MEEKRDTAFRQAVGCLPPLRAAQLMALTGQETTEELRFRAGRPPAVKTLAGERELLAFLRGCQVPPREQIRWLIAYDQIFPEGRRPAPS